MEIVVDRKILLDKLKVVGSVVKENKVKPILGCVLIDAAESLNLYGTDIERTIITRLDAEIKEKGQVAIQPNELVSYLSKLKDKEVTIKTNNNMLELVTSKTTVEFSVMNYQDFPNIKEFECGEKIKINSSVLKDLLDVEFAAAQSSDNIQVNCVRLENDKAIGTDSYRLCVKPIEENLNVNASIPLETVKVLKGVLRDDEEIELSFKDRLGVHTNEFDLYSKLIELAFPNVEQILKLNTYDKVVKLDKKEFVELLERTMITAKNNLDGKNSAIFEFKGNELLVRTFSGKSKYKETMPIEYTGKELKIALNCKFILEALKRLKDEFEIKLTNGSSMVKMADDKVVNIIMPLALRGNE